MKKWTDQLLDSSFLLHNNIFHKIWKIKEVVDVQTACDAFHHGNADTIFMISLGLYTLFKSVGERSRLNQSQLGGFRVSSLSLASCITSL